MTKYLCGLQNRIASSVDAALGEDFITVLMQLNEQKVCRRCPLKSELINTFANVPAAYQTGSSRTRPDAEVSLAAFSARQIQPTRKIVPEVIPLTLQTKSTGSNGNKVPSYV